MANNDRVKDELNGQSDDNQDAKPPKAANKRSATGWFKGPLTGRKLIAPVLTVALVAAMLSFTATLSPGGSDGQAGPEPPAVPDPAAEPAPVAAPDEQEVTTTSTWVNFYGLETTLDGQPVPVGTTVTVYDPQGVLCGEFVVTVEGRYGLLPVYGDDPLTEFDEGASEGDQLEFRLNGQTTTVLGPGDGVWASMGDLNQVELASTG